MRYRLTKIYTKTGDKGMTGLGDGTRVSKNYIRVEAYGTVDECNSAIGLVLSQKLPKAIRESLVTIQHKLLDVGGELSIPGGEHPAIHSADVLWLEHAIDTLNNKLPPLKEFILPGGNLTAAFCHLARTICRRAERVVVTLRQTEPVNEMLLKFLNRLSDYLFVVARVLARGKGGQEVLWRRNHAT